MSLGLASSTAMAGLRLTSLGTRVVADNLANADADGYRPRSLTITGQGSSHRLGASVRRDVDAVLLASVRADGSTLAKTDTHLQALSTLEQAFGIPGDPGALNSLVNRFESSLQQATVTPESSSALLSVAQGAERLASRFNGIEQQIQTLRQQADDAIGNDISALNSALERVLTLNSEIARETLLGGSPHNLIDARERVISGISEIIPIKEIERANGKIMLLTETGHTLVDDDRAEFGFTRTPGIAAGDSFATASLSGITLDGRALSSENRSLQSGRLGANLFLRDTIAPNAQHNLDLLAADLLDRFSGPQADTSLGPGELGLFTLQAGSSLPADVTGLAGKIRLSPLLNTNTGDGLWRLRSGLMAGTPGPVSDPANLINLLGAIQETSVLAPGMSALSFGDNVATQVAGLATLRLSAEEDHAFSITSFTAKSETLAGKGVDTDAELQSLLVLENAYAANARVLSVVDDMMRRLLEI